MSKQTILEQLIGLAATADLDPQIKAVAELAISEIKANQADLDKAGDEIIGLHQRIEQLSTGKILKPLFTYGKAKVKYEVNHAVNLDGVNYSVKAITENAKVQKALVEGDSSAISLVPDETNPID